MSEDETQRGLLGPRDEETVDTRRTRPMAIDGSLNALETFDGTGNESLLGLDASYPGGGIVDHFRIKRLLGRGGMGEVYLARDTRLGRRVALKVIRADKLGADNAVERFLLEARATARFSHPNIVTIHAVGEVAGVPYVALEYLEGEDLAQRMRRERVHPGEVMRIGHAVADALAEAHRHGVLHRDLKPGNIMLPRDGRIRVVDFGLAQAIEVERDDSLILDGGDVPSMPESGEAGLVGTPAYMAPEQWKDEPCAEVTDVWALGVLLYELCAGHRPFRGAITGVALAVCSQEIAPRLEAEEVPAALADLIADCLNKSPANRPAAVEVSSRLEAILRGDARAVVSAENPFRGLLAFSDRHADLFFGRDAEILAFVESLRDAAVIPVLGPSGAGKSSFVMAGVVPRLRERDRFTIVSLRPGSDPFGTLAGRLLGRGQSTASSMGETGSALVDPSRVLNLAQTLRETPSRLALELQDLARQDGGMVLLFVDQLEELYTLNGDQELRDAFMEAVCCAADDPAEPIRVVFTARDDFLGRLAATSAARSALRNMVLLQRPEDTALEEILQRPLDAIGYAYEDPAMVGEMVKAVEGEPAGLALLQFAAHRLWLRRDDERRLLLRSVYDEMGGVVGALAGHADGIVDALSRPEHRLARELLLRLVTPERTRKVVPREMVLEGLGPDAQWVLDRLVEARLLTVRKGRKDGLRISLVELAHESLTRTWGSLAQWIEDSQDDLAFLSQVSAAADHWARQKRDHALWTGEELTEAQRWLERASTEVPDRVSIFIKTSSRQQSRRQWRRRWLVLGTILALVVVDIYVLRQQRIAEDERAAAQVRRGEALREGGFASLREGNVRDARAKLRSAIEIVDAPEARALWWQLRGESKLWFKSINSFIYRAPLSPDGRYAAAVVSDGTIYLVDLRTGNVRGLHGHTDHVRAAAFSSDGRTLVSGGSDETLRLWDITKGRQLGPTVTDSGRVVDLAYGSKGRFVASAAPDGARLRKADDLSLVAGAPLPAKCKAKTVAFNGAATRLAIGCSDRKVYLIDLETMTARPPLVTGTKVDEVRFAPQGHLLAVAGGGVEIWDTSTGTKIHDLSKKVVAAGGVGFDDDAKRLAIASGHLVRIFDLGTGNVTAGFKGHESTVTSVGFIQGTDQVLSASYDRTVRIWDASSRSRARPQQGHREPVNTAAISADGQFVVSGSHDKTVRVWSVDTGAQLRILDHFGVVRGLALHGDEVAAHSWSGFAIRWNIKTGQARGTISSSAGLNVAYAPDGKSLVAIGARGQPTWWDLAESRQTRAYEPVGGRVKTVAVSPDGEYVAATYAKEGTRVWRANSTQPLRLLPQKSIISLAFSPDNRHLAVSGTDEVVIWDYLTGKALERKALEGRVWQVDYSADGGYLGAASSRGIARLWNLETGRVVDLVGHRTEINGFGFGPKGRLAVTASDDGSTRLWETETGRPYWRAPMISANPARVLTQRGWHTLADEKAVANPATWQRAASERALLGDASDVFACWIGIDGTLELWDIEADQQRYLGPGAEATDVLATPTGCAARGEQVITIDGRGARTNIPLSVAGRAVEPVALGWGAGRLLVGTDTVLLGVKGGQTEILGDVLAGLTVISGARDGQVLMGYADGNIELMMADGTKADFILEDTPVAPVSAIAFGPKGVAIVGYATGLVGVWGLVDGKHFDTARLHGAIRHILVEGDSLHAVSEFGQQLTWRLTDFLGDRCEVLRSIWREIPFTWDGGRPKVTPIPADHECAVANPSP